MKREEQIQKAAERYMKDIVTPLPASIKAAFIKGAEWTDEHPDLYSVTRKAVDRALANLWHDAQGDDLPQIDREVIVLCESEQCECYYICFGHRPDPKSWPLIYGKGGWNFPDVRWWLDVKLPNQ